MTVAAVLIQPMISPLTLSMISHPILFPSARRLRTLMYFKLLLEQAMLDIFILISHKRKIALAR